MVRLGPALDTPDGRSLLPRLERAAELVGQRSEPPGRRSILAFGVLAQFLGLARVQDRFGAEANAAWRVFDLEDDHLDVGADGKRLRDIRFPGDAGLAQRDTASGWRHRSP